MANLMDYLTILAGMYGNYRGGKEERGVERERIAAQKETEAARTAAYRDVGMIEAGSAATVAGIEAGTAKGQQATDLAKAAMEAITAGKMDETQRYLGELATIVGYNTAAMQAAVSMAQTKYGIFADQQLANSLMNWVGQQQYGLQERQYRLGTQQIQEVAPYMGAYGVGNPNWKPQQQQAFNPWQAQRRPTPELQAKADRLAGLYNQLRSTGQGNVAQALVQQFGTATSPEQLDAAIMAADRAIGYNAWNQQGAGGFTGAQAAPPTALPDYGPQFQPMQLPNAPSSGVSGDMLQQLSSGATGQEQMPEVTPEQYQQMLSQGMRPRVRVRSLVSGAI